MVVVEYVWRPKDEAQRSLAMELGIPTFGFLRCGQVCTEYGRPWHNIVAFVAQDHENAEIIGMSVNKLYASGMPEISAALAREGLSGFFTRRDQDGTIKRKVSIMTAHKKHLADASACANTDGSANWPEIMAQGTVLHEQEAAGHVKIENYTVTQTDNASGGKHIVHAYDVNPVT